MTMPYAAITQLAREGLSENSDEIAGMARLNIVIFMFPNTMRRQRVLIKLSLCSDEGGDPLFTFASPHRNSGYWVLQCLAWSISCPKKIIDGLISSRTFRNLRIDFEAISESEDKQGMSFSNI